MLRAILGDTEDVKDVTTAANRAKQQPEEAQEQQPEEQQSQGEKIMSVKVAVMVRPILENELVDGNDCDICR